MALSRIYSLAVTSTGSGMYCCYGDS
jgi:hypothetical protein